MHYLLSAACRPVLETLASERTLCAFDFDGTLAPITEYPGQAGMRSRTRALLGCVASIYPCVILSGRRRADVLSKIEGVPVRSVIGNHGAEMDAVEIAEQWEVGKWKAALERDLASLPGVWVEDKIFSLAVHYRQAPDKAAAEGSILEAARHLENARVFGGKQVVNVAPCDAPNKGDALAAERERLGCNWVLFAGDDENDEEAFAIGGNTVGVRVGCRRESHAGYYLESQGEIDQLLEVLVSLRAAMRVA